MQIKHVLAASATALAIGLAAPAAAQLTEGGNGSADDNVVVTDGLDLLSNNSLGNGNDRNNDNSTSTDAFDLLSNNGNGDNRDNDQSTTTDAIDLLSNNGNGDNRENDQSTTTDAFDLLSNNGNGDNRDNEDSGNDYSGSMNNDDGRQYSGSNVAEGGSELNQGSNNNNSSSAIVATQVLVGVNTASQMDEFADFDGEDDSDSPTGYNSGSNSVNDNAFAAYAGILNQAWNTGLNANVQAGTNIAAQGTVTFGDTGGGAGGGGGDGD
jgi:hypothetical protein